MLPQNHLLAMFNDVRLNLKPSAFDKTRYEDMSSSFEKVFFIVIFALSSRLFQGTVCIILWLASLFARALHSIINSSLFLL